MKRYRLKALISILLMFLLLFSAFSGALLHIGKTGLILGVPRHVLRDAHALAAIAVCALSAAHVFLNRRFLAREIRALFRRGPAAENEAKNEKSR